MVVFPLEGQPVTYSASQCLAYGSTTPYLPVLALQRQRCGITDGEVPLVITAKVHQALREVEIPPAAGAPVLLRLLDVPGPLAPLASLSPEALKVRTFAVLRRLSLPQQQPHVLVVENLHWIDRLSEEFCASLIDRLTGVPLLLLVTYRPEYQPAWPAKSYVSHIALQPLTPQESLTLAHAARETAPIPKAVM